MKLKNKKTGEIHEITEVVPLHDMDKKFVIYSQTEGHNYAYKNLAELNEEWQDYEEPKGIKDIYVPPLTPTACVIDFNTKEEAEKAVKKLKAWKRLKDKGFVFKGINVDDGSIKTGLSKGVSLDKCEEFYCDMELLFGGKE